MHQVGLVCTARLIVAGRRLAAPGRMLRVPSLWAGCGWGLWGGPAGPAGPYRAAVFAVGGRSVCGWLPGGGEGGCCGVGLAVHEPLIDTETYKHAQARRRARSGRAERSPRRTPRPYALRGLLFCGICGRRMQGSWNNEAAYYRCVFLSQYAAKNKTDHPRAVPAAPGFRPPADDR